MLAKHMFPEEKHPYFVVGGKNVALQNYMGEKVILWNDITAEKLLSVCPTGDIQDMLDPFQKEKKAYHIKNSSVILMQHVNIFTSTVQYRKFFKQLITDGTNVVQIYRRVPFYLEIYANRIRMGVNVGEWTGDASKWSTYDEMTIAYVNVSEIMKKIPEPRMEEVMGGVLDYICTIIDSYVKNVLKKNKATEEEILKQAESISLEEISDRYINYGEYEKIKGNHDARLRDMHDIIELENMEYGRLDAMETAVENSLINAGYYGDF
jgi:hypothetical protein